MVVAQKQSKNKDIESIYPLSPTQEGMLFHTLYEPESTIYFEQFQLTIRGNLDPGVFERAWQLLVERHSALRTLFVWKNRKQSVQVVRKEVNLPWSNLDWRMFSQQEQEIRLNSFLDSDRKQGFELDKAPLMRFALIRVADETYEFVWSFHHLLVDGWSWPIIFKELFALYESIQNGQQLYLAPSRPFRDYINWLQQQDLAGAKAFWQQNLEGFTAPTPLIVERAIGQSSHQQQNIDVRSQHLSAERTTTLKSFAQQHHLTLATLVQAAWGLLLSRYSGESDVVFGTTVSGRPPALSGVESMVGLFINTLPARVKISDKTDLLSWLGLLQQEYIEREQYSYTPLVDIQGVSEVPRTQLLFESLVVFENYPVNGTLQQLPGNLSIGELQDRGQTNYPLTLLAIPGDEMTVKIYYDRDRFDADIIDRMAGHFLTLLEGITVNPHRTPGELPLLTPAELDLLLVEWNATSPAHPINRCIHQLFEEQVEKTPQALAVVYENQQLTYEELNQQANKIAHYLQRFGVKPDVPVGICVERSSKTLPKASLAAAIAILGTLKAGGVCVPLDPSYPSERLAFMLKDSQAPVVLTQTRWKSLLEGNFAHRLIVLDEDGDEIAKESESNLQVEVAADNLAYIIYTSGSTGTPKGTLVTQRSLTNLVEHHQAKMATGIGVLQFASLSFDVSYHEISVAWGLGGTLYMISECDRKDLDKLIHLLGNNPIGKVFLPVSLWQQLAEIYGEQSHLFQNIREAIACGEQLQITQPMIKLFKRLENCTLYNFYGPTEADLVTAYTFSQKPDEWPIYPPIGKAAVNVQVYLLDSNLQSVPIGVPGELYVSGDGLARGYLNRADLTNQKFLPNPFSKDANSRLYKTGDLARYLPDGNIEFLGRIDDLVKIRGFRVELGEIEAVLSKHPQINQAVAKVHGESAREKYLVAYFVPIPGETITVEQLRAFLTEQLPDYMIPSAFVEMESFPLTPNGKINRRALPEPTTSRPELGQTFVEPRTPTEEILAGIWRDVLGLEQVGIYDNFFDLGGHSLLATQVIALTRKAFGIELPLLSLFESPAIAPLAQKIATTKAPDHQELSLKPLPSQGEPIPISLTQLELWFFDQFYPGNSIYNLPLVYRITGALNEKALEESLKEIVRRHETLRSTFQVKNGQVVYAVVNDPVFDFSIIDLRHISETERETQAAQKAEQEIKHPFDLAQGPLLRSKLWRLDEQEYLFVAVTHHIVADGWSFSVLTQELAKVYEAFCEGKPSPLTDLPIKYTDFAQWQRQWLQGQVLESQLQFWQKHLSTSPPILKLPTDHPRPPARTFKSAGQSVVLSKKLTDALKVLSQQEGVTLFMTLLAAFQTLLFSYTRQENIIVSSALANRTRVETEGLIGFFVNLLPFCTNLGGNPSFRELLGRVREVALGVYAHQEMPLIKLIEELQPVRDFSYTLINQVMFVFQNTPEDNLQFANLTLKEQFIARDTKDTAEFDLELTLEETSTGIEGLLVYRTDLFESATITKMVENFQTLLEKITTNYNQHLTELILIFEPPNLPAQTVISPIPRDFITPQNSIEEVVLTIWKEILGLDQIGTQDNFFELGGHSAQALEVICKLQSAFSVELPLIYLFEKPTVVQLAEAIQYQLNN
ncbi:amino acid adenylation domain-containing protein [Nostoc sp. UCD121]|uniref:non-ribosomal peptide synthetase n=1 Tax=unclassified Nostoc TaxID=2593658 RepID=UPI001624A4E2|nr:MULTISPECIES: non-ribosomal peptide synthetase [unclassified Nostoc]MBC1223942.1 amino acid adenylation domain-containing protein [Nostoc sp. UCD120]MBC1277859.1 amino acid adenylation domain-containing protein [Nostoc sp. UCD121]MBC1295539.1 amino acid adenylation domain-containing protein [Nostoc sp. UCD122]